MNKRHYEHTLPNIRGSLSNTYKRMTMANYGKYGFLPAIALCLLWATEVSWAQVKLVRMPVVEKSGSISSGKSIIRLWRIN